MGETTYKLIQRFVHHDMFEATLWWADDLKIITHQVISDELVRWLGCLSVLNLVGVHVHQVNYSNSKVVLFMHAEFATASTLATVFSGQQKYPGLWHIGKIWIWKVTSSYLYNHLRVQSTHHTSMTFLNQVEYLVACESQCISLLETKHIMKLCILRNSVRKRSLTTNICYNHRQTCRSNITHQRQSTVPNDTSPNKCFSYWHLLHLECLTNDPKMLESLVYLYVYLTHWYNNTRHKTPEK